MSTFSPFIYSSISCYLISTLLLQCTAENPDPSVISSGHNSGLTDHSFEGLSSFGFLRYRFLPPGLSHLCTGLTPCISTSNSQRLRGRGGPKPGPSSLGLALSPRSCSQLSVDIIWMCKGTAGSTLSQLTQLAKPSWTLPSFSSHRVSSIGLLHGY